MNRFHPGLLAGVLAALAWSGIRPHDRFTWFLETFPVQGGIVLAVATYRRFRFTNLAYVLMALHAVLLIVGGHYTYEKVPPFDWLKEAWDLSRNHYDRLGHFAQGFVPAILAREILLRNSPLRAGRWLFFLVTCVCLSISASYELIEWWVALGTGSKADAFLATQGDVWDSQWDMALALCGALLSQWTLGRWHDRQLRSVR